jgi:hypothetical protein
LNACGRPRDLIHTRVSQWPKVQVVIMNSRNRVILMAGLALLAKARRRKTGPFSAMPRRLP